MARTPWGDLEDWRQLGARLRELDPHRYRRVFRAVRGVLEAREAVDQARSDLERVLESLTRERKRKSA